jgi:hypothetical protein
MSGYLQRMVASVRTPERRVHPIVGSLYSPTPEFATAESFQAEEALLVSRPSQTASQPSGDAPYRFAARTTPAPEATASESTVKRDAPGGIPPVSTSAGPLLAPHAESIGDRPPIYHLRTPFAPQPTAGSRPSREDPATESQPIVERGYRPLLREAHAVSAPTAAAPHVPALAPRTREARPAVPGRGHQTASPHDEIEIHIGRIEVTAVQQTGTRPAAPPARKSLNLDEYLKRGSRR